MENLSENAMRVLEQRYLRRDNSGALTETPEELFLRVAGAVASAELCWGKQESKNIWTEKYFHIMGRLLFLPNSPTLMNAGTTVNQLSACFVLPVEDNMDSIFSSLKLAALIQQSGGGTGFNFSHLRPRDDLVNTTGGRASGPVSFIKIFDAATENIRQGGKRRGANMGILNIEHPDIEEFIHSKKQEGPLQNFNLSVGITDDFMKTLEKDGEWLLVHPRNHQPVKSISAKKLWNEIISQAWNGGDPGLVFLDTINATHPTPELGKIESTNPCGEVPLLPYESCNLGSVNLSKMIKGKSIEWELLEETITASVRFLDNVIEINHYHDPAIKKMVTGNRKIGLGVMGWAEMLIRLGIPYASGAAVTLAGKVMKFIQQKSREASVKLAAGRGCFPNWEKSIYYPATPLRNATCTSIAPTGSISIIADTSASIEPLFALAYQRHHVLNDETLFSINSFFLDYLRKNNLYSEKILEQLSCEGTAEQISGIPENIKEIFKTAMHIPPYWHLQHQFAFQQYTDNAVSKTINLPENAATEDIDKIYRQAWHLNLKGITIFRNNSRKRLTIETGIRSGRGVCKVCYE